MKKICFVTTISTTLKSFVLDTAKYLYESGKYDITFICNYDEAFKNDLPEYIHYIPVHMKRGVSLTGVFSVFELMKIFKREKFDYIQYSTPNASFYSAIAGWIVRVPIRLYAQWGLRYIGASGLGREILKIMEQTACLFSTHIRAVSVKNRDFAISEKLYKKEKVKIIGNGGTIGVRLDEFDISKKNDLRSSLRMDYELTDDTFVFGFIGRISRDKGTNELLQAFKAISERGYKAKLFLVGNNEDNNEIDNELIQWANQSENVVFTGPYPKNELIKFYSLFDCYVHPTYREGFGMVLQEAGAMGNAMITTDIPGASEVMEEGISCILVPPKDSDSLAAAMEELINNPDKAEWLGNNAYKRTVELYERSIMLKNIENDIKNVLGV